jgi:hypothetical protein
MIRGRFLTGAIAVAFTISAAPAFAQRSGGGEETGSAVPRSGGESGSTSSAGSSGGSAASVDDSRPDPSPAPRAADRQQSRRPSGESSRDTGSRAVPRGSGGSDAGARSGRTSGTASADEGASPTGRAGPVSSRTRDGRPQIGSAVERRPGLSGRPGTTITYYPTGRYFWPGYGFGLSYFYDPFWYDPFGYGYYGYGAPYGYAGYGGGYQGTYRDTQPQNPTGSLRLRIDPSHAEVFVDGSYAGLVSDFNGIFQRLTIEAGTRRLEIRAAGYRPAELEIRVEAGKTATYQGELERID